MHPLYGEFVKLLEEESGEKVLDFVQSKLARKELDIVTLYDQLVAPSLNNMVCKEDPNTCIWREHVRSSIVRTVIESSYRFVIEERNEKHGPKAGDKVLVICPLEEYHELGARVVADFFTLCGFDVKFVGANTPKEVVLSAVEQVRPRYIAISVTNRYNLFAAQRTIAMIRGSSAGNVKIIVGGRAFEGNPDRYKEIGADLVMQGYEDIRKLREGE
jgi:methanogenic corrinoid protein MtbC1